MNKYGTKILSIDYDERCTDLRRQISYYPKLAVIIIVVVATTINWAFANKSHQPLWALVIMVFLCQAMVIVGVFVYKSIAVMRHYLLNLEDFFNQIMPPEFRTHYLDRNQNNACAFGFYRWRHTRYPIDRLYHYITYVLVGLAFILGSYFFYLGTSDLYFKSWQIKMLLTIIALVLAVWPIRSLWLITKEWKNNTNKNTSSPQYTTETEAVSLLITDYRQRNNDFRYFADYYPRLLIAELFVLSACFGVYFASPQQNQWIFFFAPLGLLTIPIFMIYCLGEIRIIKLYLAQLEEFFQYITNREDFAMVQEDFHLGFFSFTRKQHFARTAFMPIYFSLISILTGLSIFSWWRSYLWLQNLNVNWLGFLHGLILLFLVLLNLMLYTRSLQYGRSK